MNPRTLCRSHFVAAVISSTVAPSGRRISSRIIAPLLPSRGERVLVLPGCSCVFAPVQSLDAAGLGSSTRVATSSRWTAVQIRRSAVLRSVNFVTGFDSPNGGTPANEFQSPTSSEVFRGSTAFANSASLANAAHVSAFLAAPPVEWR